MYKNMLDDIGLIAKTDAQVADAMQKELERQRRNIELIASENIVSPAVMAAAGSVVFLVNGWLRMQGIQLREVMEIKHRYNKTRPYKHGKAF